MDQPYKEIKPEKRITAVHSIEKLTPALKNQRMTKPDNDAASGRNLTDDEKIDIAKACRFLCGTPRTCLSYPQRFACIRPWPI